MRLLVDTHIVLWRMLADSRLPARAVDLMDDEANQIVVSAVSVWEVAVKHALDRTGDHVMPLSGGAFRDELRAVGLSPIAISANHVVALDGMPMHHRDPFDRLLIAQAMTEQMVLLTHDTKLADYGKFVVVV